MISLILGSIIGEVPSQSMPKVLVYKTIDTVDLKLTIFSPPVTTAPFPSVVFFFGGGWKGGSIEQFRTHATYLANRGMVGVLADYRVSSRHGSTPFDAVEDAKSAVRYLRSHAMDLNIDPGRICAAGGSAGGHLAAATATLPGLDNAAEDLRISSKPNALVLFNAVIDNGPHGYGYERVGGRFLEISPFHNLGANVAPTILFLGSDDALIPVKTAHSYRDRMRAHGNRCDLYIYQGQGHGFFNLRHEKYYRETVYQMDLFLQSLGYLAGPASILPLEMVEASARPMAHAHNDYRQKRPLTDALKYGFTSVEADILYQDGQLYVGHDRVELDAPLGTLQSLYLEPLFRRFNHYTGAIFPDYKHPFFLWVDIKYQAEDVYRKLREMLIPYKEMLWYREGGDVHQGAVKIILSGDRPFDLVYRDSLQMMFLDGRPEDLQKSNDPEMMPFISQHFAKVFSLNADGSISRDEQEKLKQMVGLCHKEGKKLRLWATPEDPNLWRMLVEAGVDLINTDHLEKLAGFLDDGRK